MSLTFTDSDSQSTDGFCKFLVYGVGGSGKTVLATTMPTPIILSAESGLLSLTKKNQLRIHGTHQNVPVILIKSVDDLSEAFAALQTPAYEQFESVVLDSVSEIAETVLSNARAKVKDPRQAYGELADKMTMLIRGFRDLPKHVYFSAKQERVADASGMLLFGPSMPGKQLTQGIGYFFDEVFALDISPRDANGGTYRFLRTQGDAQWQGKDRSGQLDAIEEPHLGKIIAKIRKQD